MAPAATSAVYWPIECPAKKDGIGSASPSAAQRSRSAARIAIEVARIAGWAFSVRSSRSAGPLQARSLMDSPSASSAVVKTAAAAGEILGDRSAHADGLGTLAGTHEGEVTHHAERRRWSRP